MIEVGIDVPNATVMVIEGSGPLRTLPASPASRQDRPRQPRRHLAFFPESSGARAAEAAGAMASTSDGFRLAELDPRDEGRARSQEPGSMACQGSGLPLARDIELLEAVRQISVR